MGGSVSVVVANIFMIHFESVALSSAQNMSVVATDFWIRFVDDILLRQF